MPCQQGCGLGLCLVSTKIVSFSGGWFLVLGHLRLVLKTKFRPNYEGHIKISYCRDDAHRRSSSHSQSFKVTTLVPVESLYAISKWILLKYILSRTVYQLLCSICEIITFDKVSLVNTLVLRNLLEYLMHQSYIAENYIYWATVSWQTLWHS